MRRVIVILAMLAAANVFAEVPNEITYQGKLKEYGQPVNGNRTVNFKIYNTASGPGLQWESGDVSVAVSSGIFSYVLTPALDWRQKDLWIETVVNGKILSPREKITSQCFALHSRTAEDLSKLEGESISFVIGGSTKARVNGSGEISSFIGSTTYYMVPRGAIIMWCGAVSEIPSGWALCNGTQATPDLRSKFIVGYDPRDSDYNILGKIGGEKTHVLTIKEMPSHTHYSGVDYGETGGIMQGYEANWSSDNKNRIYTDSTGNNEAHENRPPYYTIAFIMKI